ncbi:MAG: acyl-CoA desaturase, partial [Myxococcota bacterium]
MHTAQLVRATDGPNSNLSDLRAFGEELDRLKERTLGRVGAVDVRRLRRLETFSIAMEVVGRLLIQFSPEPITFVTGVFALFVHKQLQAIEIGHTVLHGAYDRLAGTRGHHSKRYRWDIPIDEASWREGHNVRHHGTTNVAGKDPDLEFGPVRLTAHTPYVWYHGWQLWLTLGLIVPNFTMLMNGHFTGLGEDAPKGGLRGAWWRTIRKFVPYYLENYLLFPLLAGPLFFKVLLGNWLAETMRDVYSAATIFCGHVGHDVRSFPEGTRPTSRGEWYAMQVESSNDFEVSRPLAVLCGGLERQIEHHLFPTLPPDRLREIAPEVRAICARHGVTYRTASWGRTLRGAVAQIALLARNRGLPPAPAREASARG